jgi:hypothetical protein
MLRKYAQEFRYLRSFLVPILDDPPAWIDLIESADPKFHETLNPRPWNLETQTSNLEP